MPSPLGHAMASLAVGWGTTGPADGRRALAVQMAALGAVGMAPDLDLLFGQHSGATHSIGAALIAASVAALVRWPAASTRLRIFVAVGLVWMVHPLFDAMAPHHTPPHGVMAFWPFSQDYVEIGFKPFMSISRRYWVPGFLTYTVIAVAREVIILAPAVVMAYWARRGSFEGRSVKTEV